MVDFEERISGLDADGAVSGIDYVAFHPQDMVGPLPPWLQRDPVGSLEAWLRKKNPSRPALYSLVDADGVPLPREDFSRWPTEYFSQDDKRRWYPWEPGPELSAPATMLRDFLIGGTTGPQGMSCGDIRGLSNADLYEHVELVDWLFPSDPPGLSAEAPQMTRNDMERLARDNEVCEAVRRNYHRMLEVFGLVLHHHGSVHFHSNVWIASAHDDALIRIVRSLGWLRLVGYSRTGGSETVSYAVGLAECIAYLWGKQRFDAARSESLLERCRKAVSDTAFS